MKPSEQIYELAEEYASREGELIRRPTENYWLRATLDYLDEQAERREDERPAAAPSFKEAQQEPGSGIMGMYATAVENRLRRIEAILRAKAKPEKKAP